MRHATLAILIFTSLFPALVRSQTTREALRARQRDERTRMERLYAKEVMPGKTFSMADVCRLTLHDGEVRFQTALPEVAMQSRVKIEGMPGLAVVTNRRGPGTPYLSLAYYDFTGDEFVSIQSRISWREQYTTISQNATRLDNTRFYVSWNYRRDANAANQSRVTFTVYEFGPNAQHRVLVQATATDAVSLLRQHSREVQQYLRPVMRHLHQEHLLAIDPAFAWGVFCWEWRPRPEVADRAMKLLAELDDPSPEKRSATRKSLAALGRQGALALLHADRSHLSPEQNATVNRLLADQRVQPLQQAKELASDPQFLLDCLYTSDPEVLSAAVKRLESLQGRKLAFDPKAPESQRWNAIDALRKQFKPPATQPHHPPIK